MNNAVYMWTFFFTCGHEHENIFLIFEDFFRFATHFDLLKFIGAESRTLFCSSSSIKDQNFAIYDSPKPQSLQALYHYKQIQSRVKHKQSHQGLIQSKPEITKPGFHRTEFHRDLLPEVSNERHYFIKIVNEHFLLYLANM